ncbi:hypothetical protein AtDm6_2211 [Acetobacter tropicalis]|uniref:Uncharacterized protein n=1 Tax=Acetobacter tropicalis TaxID=104102 RepID=A0A094YKR1_9PROT|nr:hypothetical protein AtDm6_2211 [Acetobacter tropicalis]
MLTPQHATKLLHISLLAPQASTYFSLLVQSSTASHMLKYGRSIPLLPAF